MDFILSLAFIMLSIIINGQEIIIQNDHKVYSDHENKQYIYDTARAITNLMAIPSLNEINFKGEDKNQNIKTEEPFPILSYGQITNGVLSPTISISANSISGVFYQYLNSPPLVYIVSANSLSSNLVITAVTDISPGNFEGGIKISLSPDSDFTTELQIVPVNGSIPNTIIYVKIPSGFWDLGQYIGNINHSSTGVNTISIPSMLECTYPPTRTAPIASLGNIYSFPNNFVIVPLIVDDYEFISSVNYTIEFNPQVLTYQHFDNVNDNILYGCEDVILDSVSPVLCRLYIYIGCSPDYWYAIPNGETLLDLIFYYHTGSTDLNFTNGSYTLAWGGNVGYIDEPFDSYYQDGSVGPYPKILNIKLNLEGLYNTTTGNMNKANGETGPYFPGNIADMFSIKLAQELFPYTVVFEMDSLFLDQDGNCQIGLTDAINENYFIIIRHRNSIETWTAEPIPFSESISEYDFTISADKAFGSNLKNLEGTCGIFGGDVNQDGFVDTGDMTPVDNDGAAFANGYLTSDVNGDGIVDTGDMSIIDNNTRTFTGAVYPTTITLPSITTSIVANITNTTAEGGGYISNCGGSLVTQRGICWNTIGDPTINDPHTTNGNGSGYFNGSVTGLVINTPYFIRAYATNTIGTSYGNTINFTSGNCGTPFTLTHTVGSVSPVNKTVTYGTVETNLSGSTKCWITQNLGADHQAISATDDSEASAGWYWQFNRPQGYKHDGTTRTPNTVWNTIIEEYINWQPSNDPCALLLGSSWRIPTVNEWSNVRSNGGWQDAYDSYSSLLKLHLAGEIIYDGSIVDRGIHASYWSSEQNKYSYPNYDEAWALSYWETGDATWLWERWKPQGFSIRCLNEPSSAAIIPSILTLPITNVTMTSAESGGEVSFDGDSPILAYGVCWSTSPMPSLENFFTTETGNFNNYSSLITGLSPSTFYYLRAYVTNNNGTAYGNEVSFITTSASPCTSFTITHSASNISPVNKTVTYGTVLTNLTGSDKCWITQNLGADHQATDATDATEESAGWYWQFNHKQGFKHDGLIRTPNIMWIVNIIENSDWTYANDPCILLLGGWRIPTKSEWQNAFINGGWENVDDTYASVLKIHTAGYLESEGINKGNLANRGNIGQIWSSNQTDLVGCWHFDTNLMINETSKSTGMSVRCLKD